MVNAASIIRRFAWAILLMLFSLPSFPAEISAHTDRASIGLKESFTLVFETTGSVDGSPDFTPLQKDFDILNQNQSSNISIANGSVTRNKSWTLQLFPKHDGEITIPAIAFGRDKSPTLTINVTQQSNSNHNKAGQDIFIEVSAEPKSAYVQQQVVYTVKLYRSVITNNASLTEPKINSSDAVLQKLGEDRNYDTVIGGQRYAVFERRYVLFPQKAGTLRIPPVRFTGTVGSGRQGFFDFDPFNHGGKMVQERSDAVELEVKPIPANYKGHYWLPAESVQLSESWSPDPPVFTVGEPVTRSVTLAAAGQTAAQLPELKMNIPAELKQYPDQPNLQDNGNGHSTIGTRIEKLALIPTHPGRYTLPAIEVPWWNTQTQQQEVARLPSRVIEVAPAANMPPSETTAAPAAGKTVSPQTTGNTLPVTSNSGSAGFWPWLSLLLVLGWMGTLLLWWRQSVQNRRNATNDAAVKPKPDPAIALKRLRSACQNNDPQTAKQALLQWAQARWPARRLLSLDAVAAIAGDTASEQIRLLSDRLYRPGVAEWQGHELWKAIEHWKPAGEETTAANKPALEPLHRIHSP